MAKREWQNVLPARTIFKEAPDVAIGQIFMEKDIEQMNFLIERLREYFDEYNYSLVSEAIKEEKEKIEALGEKITKKQFIANVYMRVEKKKRKKKTEKNRKKKKRKY